MAKFYQMGKTIDYKNPGTTDIGYGHVIPLGTRVGVAEATIPAGDLGAVRVEGVFIMPAAAAEVYAVGAALYWDATAKQITSTATGNTLAGWAVEPKAASAAEVKIKIGGAA